MVSHPARGIDLWRAVKKNGAKLIVVDPRRTQLAKSAHIWFQIRPGTDLALVLAMLHTIINENLYDREFVERHCYGFEELRKHIQNYSPAWASPITWLSAESIANAARLFATTKPAVVHHRVGVEQNLNSTQTIRAIAILVAITGNLGIKGGNLLQGSVPGFVTTMELMKSCDLPAEKAEVRLGGKEFPLTAGTEPLFTFVHPAVAARAALTGEPYPLKALLLAGGNPVVNMQNTRRTWELFKSLECFVVIDYFLTPTAELADYVLPATTWLERDDCEDEPYLDCIAARQKVIEPPPECRDDMQIAIDLASRLPWVDRKYLPWKSSEEFHESRVRGIGMTFEEFKRKGYVGFDHQHRGNEERRYRTPSGKVELVSTIFAKHGYDPLPVYVEPPHSPLSTPEIMKEYPYILITGSRTMQYYLSSGRQIKLLRKQMPEPLFEMHPETARKESLHDGDWVWIETPLVKGERVRMQVRITSELDPRVVHAQACWWFPENAAPDHGCFESNINLILTDDPPREPICGSVPLRGTLCKCYPAAVSSSPCT
jgi:anaerobic selenocysteine-containing dehydrogenase